MLGADFQFPLPPTRVIEGIVRDAKTGQPIAGAGVQSLMFSGTNTVGERLLRTKSDDKGHFRLVGLPKGSANKIIVVPGDEQPYLMREAAVPDAPGLEPAHVDVELHRGVVITGRVTDALTGEPVPMARLLYLPFLSNEYARALPEFEGGHAHPGYDGRYQAAADGSYRLVGLPGRAIVGVVEPGSKVHVQGQGASEIEGMDSKGEFLTVRNPIPARNDWPTAMKEINPADESQSVELDFALDSGGQVEIATVDPAGQPISGVMVTGMSSDRSRQPASAPSFVATSFGPAEERTILLNHEKRGLGKVVRVRAVGEGKKITVRLEPCAKIIGRLVDHSNEAPVAGAEIRFEVLPHEEFPPQLQPVTTDANGRFEQPAALPGASYTIIAEHPSIGSDFRRLARGLAVSPGETIDLGTIDVTSDKRPEPVRTKSNDAPVGADSPKGADSQAAVAADDEQITIRGRVLDPTGQPSKGRPCGPTASGTEARIARRAKPKPTRTDVLKSSIEKPSPTSTSGVRTAGKPSGFALSPGLRPRLGRSGG